MILRDEKGASQRQTVICKDCQVRVTDYDYYLNLARLGLMK
jgi:serine/threonine-protein kinase ULK/ATG1